MEQQQTDLNIEDKRGRKGRKSGKPKGRKDQGQEAVIKLESLQIKLPELIQLYKSAEDAGKDLNDAIKAAAEASGLLAATVSKFVRARAGDKFEDAKTKAMQLSLVFEEVVE